MNPAGQIGSQRPEPPSASAYMHWPSLASVATRRAAGYPFRSLWVGSPRVLDEAAAHAASSDAAVTRVARGGRMALRATSHLPTPDGQGRRDVAADPDRMHGSTRRQTPKEAWDRRSRPCANPATKGKPVGGGTGSRRQGAGVAAALAASWARVARDIGPSFAGLPKTSIPPCWTTSFASMGRARKTLCCPGTTLPSASP